jgi:hypothetical protein
MPFVGPLREARPRKAMIARVDATDLLRIPKFDKLLDRT